jgi:hypothetical protein
MRSSLYDTVENVFQILKQNTKSKNQILKSNPSDSLRLSKVDETTQYLAETLYNQFLALKDDFKSGRINQARYCEGLTTYQDFFATEQSVALKEYKSEIETEIAKFLSPIQN